MNGQPVDIETRKVIKISLMQGERVSDLARRYNLSTATVSDIGKMTTAILYADEAPDPRVSSGGRPRRRLKVAQETGERFACEKLRASMRVSDCAKRWYQATKLLYEPYLSCRGCERSELHARQVGLAGLGSRKATSRPEKQHAPAREF